MTAEELKLRSLDTKERIISHAIKMFSESGYEGTSIRQLAKEAEVNIAAINYHFENKENLYYQVLVQSHEKISKEFEGISKNQKWNPEDLVVEVFNHLLKNGEMLVAVFKVFLSASSAVHHKLCDEKDFEGPPGASHICEIFSRKYPKALRKDLIFVTRTIFTSIIHYAVVASSLKDLAKVKKNEFKPTLYEMRSDLKRMTLALERELG